jgi:hypothetical protein
MKSTTSQPREGRRNLPEEDRLLLAVARATAACRAALGAHDGAAAGGHCWCPLCEDLTGTLYNLENGELLIGCELMPVTPPEGPGCPGIEPGLEWQYRRGPEEAPYALLEDRLWHGPATPDLPQEAELMRLLQEVLEAGRGLLDAHDGAAAGDCQCSLCQDVWALRWNLRQCHSLLHGQLMGPALSATLLAELTQADVTVSAG